MSRIIDFKKEETVSTKNKLPVEVNCLYETQTFCDGTKMLILKTYNPNSINSGISQTIHLTKETSLQLIEIIKKEFSL